MALSHDCIGCQDGDHTRHNPLEGAIPHLIGGTVCPCTGDCAERLEALRVAFRTWLDDLHHTAIRQGPPHQYRAPLYRPVENVNINKEIL